MFKDCNSFYTNCLQKCGGGVKKVDKNIDFVLE